MKKHLANLKKHLRSTPMVTTIIIFLIIFGGLTFFVRSQATTMNTFEPSSPPVAVISPSPEGLSDPEITPTPKPATSSAQKKEITGSIKLPKQSYTIALIGDSLIDTMGENTDYLQKNLSARYAAEFKLYNYGIGAQNVEQGLSRFNNPFAFKDRNYPPLPEIHPDIIIIGSFSYNPFPTHDVEKHHRLLQSMINQARGVTPKVYLLAEIAPLKTHFGEGPGGVNWPEDKAATQALHIIEQLEDTVKLGKMENVPVINAFQSSKVDGNYGNPSYISEHDGIHPSVNGHIFMAEIIAKALKF